MGGEGSPGVLAEGNLLVRLHRQPQQQRQSARERRGRTPEQSVPLLGFEVGPALVEAARDKLFEQPQGLPRLTGEGPRAGPHRHLLAGAVQAQKHHGQPRAEEIGQGHGPGLFLVVGFLRRDEVRRRAGGIAVLAVHHPRIAVGLVVVAQVASRGAGAGPQS